MEEAKGIEPSPRIAGWPGFQDRFAALALTSHGTQGWIRTNGDLPGVNRAHSASLLTRVCFLKLAAR